MPDTPIIYYHANCYDGAAGAYLAARHFARPCDMRPVSYTDAPPDPADLEGRLVFFIDFSFDEAVMDAIHAAASHLLVLDHHASRSWLQHRAYGRFSAHRSGVGLAGLTFGDAMPLGRTPMLDAIEARDLWRPDRDMVLDALITSFPPTLEGIDALLGLDPRSARTVGEALLEKRRADVAAICAGAVLISAADSVWGVPFWYVQSPLLRSEVGDALVSRGVGASLALVSSFDLVSGTWRCSLRGEGAQAAAEKFGGGGHPKAAGFHLVGPLRMLPGTSPL